LKQSHVNFLCTYFRLKMVVRPKHVADNLNKIVNNYWNRVSHVNFLCSYFHLKMVVRPKHVADNLNKIVRNYWNRVRHVNFRYIYFRLKIVVRPKHVADNLNKIVSNYWNRVSHVNFLCTYFHLKMVVRPKHVADNLIKTVDNYWNRVALDGNPWTWSSTRNSMQTPKFKTYIFCMKMVVRPKHAADNLNTIVDNYWNRVALDGNPWTWSSTACKHPNLRHIFSAWRWSYDRNMQRIIWIK
jgi:uncharacterized protein YktA (UPF0223 family)